METAVGVLGEVRVESRGAFYVFTVMINYFLQICETAIVHIGRGEFDIAKTRSGEFAEVGFTRSDFETAGVGDVGEVQAVVVELMVREERAAVAMEAIRAVAAHARFVFRHEQFEAALFLSSELG